MNNVSVLLTLDSQNQLLDMKVDIIPPTLTCPPESAADLITDPEYIPKLFSAQHHDPDPLCIK